MDIPSTATRQALASIRVYPGRDAYFTLYDDDGISNDDERGTGKSTYLHWDDKAGKLTAMGGQAVAVDKLRQVVGK